ncbi:MCE family protein [Antrihabitans stalactiti]|uniref:MCE family protein n=1 Tax=Antrihabitans stalactiti TaxID=2584121 RepID=A0A848KNK7_9NOCA|nr:MCE family protein [Antrihabitans stalactiti]NMN97890.1 MCE family protein [Antrihabitans stalactiti]
MIHTPSNLRKRVLGVSFFLVLALFVWGSIAMYNKTFKDVVEVGLVTDTVGNSLPKHADVKVRGLTVGEVRSTKPEGGKVHAVMAIDPDKADQIPANVTARLLPKTLFGERYVSLIIPPGTSAGSGDHLTSDSVVEQDRSGNAIELNRLLDSVLPLLQAIPPQDLMTTLSAVAKAIDGRGEELGTTIERLDTIFAGINTEMPNLQESLRSLATFSQTYSDAAPQLVEALDNLRTTNATIVERRSQIDAVLASVTSTGSTATDFLAANRDNIVDIAADSREALELLATYSPTFTCTLRNFAAIKPRTDEILGKGSKFPGSRVTIEVVNTRGKYLPNQDEPRFLDTRGPQCAPEAPLGVDAGQYPGGANNDGSYQPPSRNPGGDVPTMAVPQFSLVPADFSGSTAEHETLSMVYGAATGIAPQDIPQWTLLFGAPALRGSEVRMK